MSQKILVAAVALMVHRDAMTKLPVTVPAHELPIMHAVHGDENVTVTGDAGSMELEVEAEVARLEQKYGGGEGSPLEAAYDKTYKTAIVRAMKEHAAEAADGAPKAKASKQ